MTSSCKKVILSTVIMLRINIKKNNVFSLVLVRSDFSEANRRLEFWNDVLIINTSINFFILIWTKIICWNKNANRTTLKHYSVAIKCVGSGGFFSKARLKISSRDTPAKKGKEKECEPTNIGRTLPDVDFTGYHFTAYLFFLYWLYQMVRSVFFLPSLYIENIFENIFKNIF